MTSYLYIGDFDDVGPISRITLGFLNDSIKVAPFDVQ